MKPILKAACLGAVPAAIVFARIFFADQIEDFYLAQQGMFTKRTASPRVIKVLWRWAAVLVMAGLVVVWGNYKIHRVPRPKSEKLADCTSESLSFPMTVHYDQPYHFVLGLPHSLTGQLSFRGEVEIRQSNQLLARIPISSEDITTCNWLEPKAGLAGYILALSRINNGERLSQILARGRTYNVQVAFSQSPPRDSSLWLTSIGRVGDPWSRH